MSEHFSGYDPESGPLQRARTWRDLFPLLVLLHALRVAGSPIYVGLWWLATVASHVCLTGELSSLAGGLDVTLTRWPMVGSAFTTLQGARWVLAGLISLLPMVLCMRAGAIYAAGRDAEPTLASIKLITKAWLRLLQVWVLPLICVLGLLVPFFLLGASERIPGVGPGLAEVIGVLLLPLAVLAGMIAAGSLVAIPLACTSIVLEKRQDPFDALSRGYEYLYRRPVHTALYVAISVGLSLLMYWGAAIVTLAAAVVCEAAYRLFAEADQLPSSIRIALAHLPVTIFLASFTGLWGAIYLLLRKDANQQEIDDLALSPVDRRESRLPTLKPDQDP